MKNRKQLLFYILLNIIVSAATTLLVLWIWDKPNRSRSHRGAPGFLLPAR